MDLGWLVQVTEREVPAGVFLVTPVVSLVGSLWDLTCSHELQGDLPVSEATKRITMVTALTFD